MRLIKELDAVALTEDRETKHFETGEPIKLYKGQVGTIIMEYDGTAFEVEFSNFSDGTVYAMEMIAAKELILLHYELVQLTA